jgi:hypothetical protein
MARHCCTRQLLEDTRQWHGGADVNADAKDGATVLYWAALGGHEAVVRLLTAEHLSTRGTIMAGQRCTRQLLEGTKQLHGCWSTAGADVKMDGTANGETVPRAKM